jgi:hypothetical protein
MGMEALPTIAPKTLRSQVRFIEIALRMLQKPWARVVVVINCKVVSQAGWWTWGHVA